MSMCSKTRHLNFPKEHTSKRDARRELKELVQCQLGVIWHIVRCRRTKTGRYDSKLPIHFHVIATKKKVY